MLRITLRNIFPEKPKIVHIYLLGLNLVTLMKALLVFIAFRRAHDGYDQDDPGAGKDDTHEFDEVKHGHNLRPNRRKI